MRSTRDGVLDQDQDPCQNLCRRHRRLGRDKGHFLQNRFGSLIHQGAGGSTSPVRKDPAMKTNGCHTDAFV